MAIEYTKDYPTISEGEKKYAKAKAERLEKEHKARKQKTTDPEKPKQEKAAKK